jgi:hypothetical protein
MVSEEAYRLVLVVRWQQACGNYATEYSVGCG